MRTLDIISTSFLVGYRLTNVHVYCRLGAGGWHNPTLEEVVKMLSYNMLQVQQNAAAYIQHLCFNNDKVKADVRKLGKSHINSYIIYMYHAGAHSILPSVRAT